MADMIPQKLVADTLGISEEELRRVSREHLEYRKDYFMHPKDKMRYASGAVEVLQEYMLSKSGVDKVVEVIHPKSDIFLAHEDEVLDGKVFRTLPPNPRMVWITVDGFEGRQECNLPPRFRDMYRKPGKRIPVRHVEGIVFQFAIKDWIDDEPQA